jgi:hypothetical protein
MDLVSSATASCCFTGVAVRAVAGRTSRLTSSFHEVPAHSSRGTIHRRPVSADPARRVGAPTSVHPCKSGLCLARLPWLERSGRVAQIASLPARSGVLGAGISRIRTAVDTTVCSEPPWCGRAAGVKVDSSYCEVPGSVSRGVHSSTGLSSVPKAFAKAHARVFGPRDFRLSSLRV